MYLTVQKTRVSAIYESCIYSSNTLATHFIQWLMLVFDIFCRLTTDVQEFKSSFKQCINQGLRSVTQIVGCVVSLYFISPQMTVVVSVCLPGVIFVGSLIGVVLRRWSREAQEQVYKIFTIIAGACYILPLQIIMLCGHLRDISLHCCSLQRCPLKY